MEAKDVIRSEQPAASDYQCAECLSPAVNVVFDSNGEPLCGECAAAYYVECAVCRGLIPRDEAVTRDGAACCGACAEQAAGVEAPDDAEVEALVSRYLALYPEHKRISDEMEEIKERLKLAASLRERVAGAVTLRGGDGAVRCNYTVKVKCDPEKTAALEAALGQERFAALFEKKVTFNAVKDRLEAFLSDEEADAHLREAVREAIEKVETPSLSIVRQR
ncbi:MAG TPA: hypothetical protein VNO70_20550 [Blastocatellia bacterium]|nr:hypothetical protein [Blastocatellia bacterium]